MKMHDQLSSLLDDYYGNYKHDFYKEDIIDFIVVFRKNIVNIIKVIKYENVARALKDLLDLYYDETKSDEEKGEIIEFIITSEEEIIYSINQL